MKKGILTKEEKNEWEELYKYVKKDILGYSEDMKLPKRFILRLQGLHKGVFLANKNIPNQAEYSYRVILLTFKMKKFDIMVGMKNNTFKDENHKLNYIMLIVEGSLNDTVLRMEKLEKEKVKAGEIEININEEKAEYVKKTKETKNKRLKDLW